MYRMLRTVREGWSEEALPKNMEEMFATLKDWRAEQENSDEGTIGIRVYKFRRVIYKWEERAEPRGPSARVPQDTHLHPRALSLGGHRTGLKALFYIT